MDGTDKKSLFLSRLLSVFGTLGMMWAWLTLVVIVSGLFDGGETASNILSYPFVGIMPNVMLRMNHTIGPAAVMNSFWTTLLAGCVLAPFAEEAIFRGFVCHRMAQRGEDGRPKDWWPIIVFSFLLFGFLHTFSYAGVLLQGVTGLFLAMLWFRNGPSQRGSYFSCVAAHSLYNLSVIGSMVLANRLLIQVLTAMATKSASAGH